MIGTGTASATAGGSRTCCDEQSREPPRALLWLESASDRIMSKFSRRAQLNTAAVNSQLRTHLSQLSTLFCSAVNVLRRLHEHFGAIRHCHA